MSARAIVSGSLHKAVELRTSKAGKAYAPFTIRESINGGTRWWQAIAFGEGVIEALLELAAGDPIAVAGTIDAEIYAPAGGEARLSWKINADAVLSARAKPKEGRPRRTPEKVAPQQAESERGGPNDDIPF